MRERFTILNSFIHDVATGTWISSLAVAAMLRGEARAWPAVEVARFSRALGSDLMWLTWAALVTVLLTGVVRYVTFRAFGWTGDIARDRIRLLKVKHAVLGTVFAVGTVWQVLLLR